jgi:DNA polymerase-3 subunit beta
VRRNRQSLNVRLGFVSSQPRLAETIPHNRPKEAEHLEQSTLMPQVDHEAPAPAKSSPSPGAEVTVNNRDLLKELAALQRVVSRKSTIPILQNIQLQATQNGLFLTASDSDMGLRTVCSARVKKEGRFTIPAHKLYDYVRLLEDGDVSMRLLENQWVQIRSGRSHTKMVGMSPDHFPKLPLFPAASAIKLDASVLQQLITRTMFAASEEESRYTLCGAMLVLRPDGLTMVATDGHRLALTEYAKAHQQAKELRVLVPKKTLLELSSLLAASSAEHVQFAQDDSTLYFAVGTRLLTSRQIMGKFPDYEAILPKDHPNQIVINRNELQVALQRVGQFSDERSNCVRVKLGKNECRLTSSTPESGESEDVLTTKYSGEAKTMAFNSQYLLEFLKAIQCDTVRLHFKDGESPSEFRPEDSDNKELRYRYLVMPLRA